MVLMSAGKAARHTASIVNRPTCGGNKKAGLAPKTGCIPNRTTQTQKYGYSATHGGNMG